MNSINPKRFKSLQIYPRELGGNLAFNGRRF